jgi:N-methylhydantoinase B
MTHAEAQVAEPEKTPAAQTDPITAEVIRHALVTYAGQMSVALERAAFSSILYNAHDFACTLYDNKLRLLAQDQGLPAFSGVMGTAIEACVEKTGGKDKLQPGDVLMSSFAYDIGGHTNDLAIVVPVFYEGELAGFAANKAHNMDLGQMHPMLSLDSTDIWQEGLILPGVKLYDAGTRNEDLYRTIVANSRLPRAIAGDINAAIGSAEIGRRGLESLIARHGLTTFRRCVDAILDHDESVTRRMIAEIPDGRYTAEGIFEGMIDDELLPVPIAVEVAESEITVDLTAAPDQRLVCLNSPAAALAAVVRVMVVALADKQVDLNDGHLRPISVLTRPGSMFHPLAPAPVALFMIARSPVEWLYRALSDAIPGRIPAQDGSNLVLLFSYGANADGSRWGSFCGLIGGQGALPDRDGGAVLPPIQYGGLRMVSCEALESRTPFVVDRYALATDSAGAGQFRGYPGFDIELRARRPLGTTIVLDRTKVPAYGLRGGLSGRANFGAVVSADGCERPHTKSSQVPIEAGGVIRISTGGGGGYGPPALRDPDAVHQDLREGLISEAAARRDYPHAFSDTPLGG